MRLSNSFWRMAVLALVPCLVVPAQSEKSSQSAGPVKKSQASQPAAEPTTDQQDPQALKLETTLVTVPVIASDREGRYTPDLRSEEFSILENGVKQEIVFFATVNEPFHVVLMLDTSASTQEKLGQIRSAASAFVDQLKPADRVRVISFDDRVYDLCEFTNDRDELKRAINQTNPGQGTKLYDAVALALNLLKRVQGRKAIVLFTDGVDMRSDTARYENNLSDVEESGVIVYPIRYDTRAEVEAMLRQGGLGGIIKRPPTGTTPTTVPGGSRIPQLPPVGPPTGDPRIPPTGSPFPRTTPYPGTGRMPDDRYPDNRYPDNRNPDPRSSDPRYPDPSNYPSDRGRGSDRISTELDALYRTGDRYLNDLAAKSGGKLNRADTLYSLPAAFAQIAAELRTQYALGYYSSNPARDGSYRKIQVRTTRKGVVVRARPGYRAANGS